MATPDRPVPRGPEWDDELVPLSQLRPAPQAFGAKPAKGTAKPRPKQAQGRTGSETVKRPRQPVQASTRTARPASEVDVREQQALHGQPVRPASRTAGQGNAGVPAPRAPGATPPRREPAPQQRPQPQQSAPAPQPVRPFIPQQRRPVVEPQAQAPRSRLAPGFPAPVNRPKVRHAESPLHRQAAERHEDHELDLAALKPQNGWRGALLKTTGLNLGPSAADREFATIQAKVRKPVEDGTIAVFSRKGGVGKTTISAYLGTVLASLRNDRVVALDGDAEAGSLGWLLAPKAPSTLHALAAANPAPRSYEELRRYTTRTDSGLEVIVGEPAENGMVSTAGMESVANVLATHYDLSIFDTGAGVTRATGRVLVNRARVLLLVMGPSVDSVRAAERTLAWIEENPGEAADPNAQVIAVINGIPADAKKAHIDRIESLFAQRCDAVVRVPWDAYLAEGNTTVSVEALDKATQTAFVELGATAIDLLSHTARPSANLGVRHAS